MVSELVAAGCGDRQRIRETWTLRDYEDQARAWDIAPPPYVSMAALAGIKPKAAKADEDGEPIEVSMEEFEMAIAQLGMGTNG